MNSLKIFSILVILICFSSNNVTSKIIDVQNDSLSISVGYKFITTEIDSIVPKAFAEVEKKIKTLDPIVLEKEIFNKNILKVTLEDFNLEGLEYKQGDISLKTPYEASKLYVTVSKLNIIIVFNIYFLLKL